jgi:hypothetical protein
MLKGVSRSWIMKKRNKPSSSELMRESDFKVNFFGGIGMYHRKAQTRRNRNRFKAFTKV